LTKITHQLTGKVAIITGGGSGIGRASCLAFAAAGAQVVVASRTLSKAQAVAGEITAAGGTAAAMQVNVGSGESVQQMIERTGAQYGGVDILFNNAGISPGGSVTEITEAEWDECLNIDLKSVFLGAKYAVPEMQKRGGGAILNTAGTFGITAAPHKAAYSAAKAGVIALTKSIAFDYGRDSIRCNVICPGYVNTPLTAHIPDTDRDAYLGQVQLLRGVIQPEEVAALALYLASDAARMVTGQMFVIDGGQRSGLM
jgi:3-oxoacyl-[acyl-carrier protein] reductase